MKYLSCSAIVIGSLLCFGLAHSATYKIDRASDPTLLAEWQAKMNQPPRVAPVMPLASASYSDTTAGGPTWARPFADCTGTSGLGPVTYHSQPIIVSVSGAYTISSAQAFDGYLFVYAGSFSPTAPNTGCLVGNDDGAGGIGTSDITTNLTAGSVYFVVTTGFEAGEEGTFTNTIDGPGTISLGTADLVSITKTAPSGIATGGTFTYSLLAQAVSATPASGVVVTDSLPGSVSYVSNSCGAMVTGNTVTWNIGTLAGSSNQTCTVTVRNPSAVCAAISNTATISTTDPESNLANNSSTISNGGGNIVADPSFESGSPNSSWAEASSNFGSPVCDVAGCGTGTGTGPRTGNFWVWFGGIAAPETGSMSQSIVIPTGATAITFWAEFPICANGTDFVRLTIDGTQVWREDGTSPRCNTVGYTQVSVPLGAFANGAAHNVQFESTISGVPTGSNFFIDDVAIASSPVCTAAAQPAVFLPVPANGLLSLLALLAGLIGITWLSVRKHA